MVQKIPESLPGACGGWPGSEPDDQARQKTIEKRMENQDFRVRPTQIIEQTNEKRTVRTDRLYGPSVRTVRTDRPCGPSVRTVRTDRPNANGPSVPTVRTDRPYGRFVRTVRTDRPYRPSVRMVRTDRPDMTPLRIRRKPIPGLFRISRNLV